MTRGHKNGMRLEILMAYNGQGELCPNLDLGVGTCFVD